MADNPYSSLPDHRFWRKAVASLPPFALDPIVATPFKISSRDKVATAGSCFAQEIAHRLQQSGYHYYLPERPPEGMSAAEAERRNYSMYSCRYGNLYTTTQLLQLIQRAYGDFTPDLDVWTTDDGRVVDPFRPRIEPDAFLQRELEAKIQAALDELPEKQRLAVLLCRENELSYEEIADVLGLSLSATKSLIHRARETLKLRLKPYLQTGAWEEDPAETLPLKRCL